MSARRPVQPAASAVVAAAALLLLLAPSASQAQTNSEKKEVTIVARVCPSYDSIRGNRARNNIMESLKELGPDTLYGPGEALTADKEAAPPQDACQPITSWRFTLGTGYQSKAVVAPGAHSRRSRTRSAPRSSRRTRPLFSTIRASSSATRRSRAP
jgi:hypothetical protein